MASKSPVQVTGGSTGATDFNFLQQQIAARLNPQMAVPTNVTDLETPVDRVNQLTADSFERFNPQLREPGIQGASQALDAVPMQTQEDIAEVTGVPFVAPAMMDAEGNPQPLDPAAYDAEYRKRLGVYSDISAAAQRELGGDIGNFSGKAFANDVLTAEVEANIESNDARSLAGAGRYASTLPEGVAVNHKTVEALSDSIGPSLEAITRKSFSGIFDSSKAPVVELATDQGTQALPVGVAISYEYAVEQKTQAADLGQVVADYAASYGPRIATLSGLAKYKALSQLRADAMTRDPNWDPDDATGLQDMASLQDSMQHFLRTGADNMGIPLSKGAPAMLVNAELAEAQRSGEVVPFKAPNGRVYYFASNDAKDVSHSIDRFNDVVVGDRSRRGYSTVPTATGTSIERGRPALTRRAIRLHGMVTEAADATKTWLGAMPLGYIESDVKRVSLMFADVLAPHNMDERGFSNSVFAQRFKLSEKDFESARLGYQRSEADLGLSKDAFEAKRENHARTVFEQKLTAYKYELTNASSHVGMPPVYSEWMHSPANQRFFPASSHLDYMSSKAVIRDMLSIRTNEKTSGGSLFDPEKVARLKAQAAGVFTQPGEPADRLLKAMPPGQLAAIGAMYNAVLYYYTAIAPLPGAKGDIRKVFPSDAIKLYTPDIANALADLGDKYKAWLDNPESTAQAANDPHMAGFIGQMASVEVGEGKGTYNLWQDFSNLREMANKPMMANSSVALTHHSFDDGNQNGIFIQSLMFAGANQKTRGIATRLGTAKPHRVGSEASNQFDDLRTHSSQVAQEYLERYFDGSKDPRALEKKNAWRMLFEELEDRLGKETLAKELMKNPLMQAAYGKDASMFFDHVNDFLRNQLAEGAQGGKASEAYERFRAAGYDMEDGLLGLTSDLNRSVESALREVLNSTYSGMMKSLGRYLAMLAKSAVLPGSTGDTMVVTSTALIPKSKQELDNTLVWKKSYGNGSSILMVEPQGRDTTDVQLGGQTFQFQSGQQRGLNSQGAKPPQKFYNPNKNAFDVFVNPLGSAMSRLFAVMFIQSIDGDLVKFTTMQANAGRKVPLGALWVHDSIIATPGSSLIYRNAYNNIAIPAMRPYMEGFGKLLDNYVKKAEAEQRERFLKNPTHAVGIGSEGEFAAVGSYFDEIADRIDENGAYKEHFFRSNAHLGEVKLQQKWKEKTTESIQILTEAIKHGYLLPKVRASKLSPSEEGYYGVTPPQLMALQRIARNRMKMDGPTSDWSKMVANWSNNVGAAFDDLAQAAGVGGIWQMSPSGGSAGVSRETIQSRVQGMLKRLEEENEKQVRMTEEEANRKAKATSQADRFSGALPASMRSKEPSLEDLINSQMGAISEELGTREEVARVDSNPDDAERFQRARAVVPIEDSFKAYGPGAAISRLRKQTMLIVPRGQEALDEDASQREIEEWLDAQAPEFRERYVRELIEWYKQ